MHILRQMSVIAGVLLPVMAMADSTPTIDIMNTGTLGGYSQTYTPGQSGNSLAFQVGPVARSYKLSDGTSWQSGAGSFKTLRTSIASVDTDNGMLRYIFTSPQDGILFSNTDYSFGDHSAQGTLGVPTSLTLEANSGATTGVMKGYTTILSNDMTWYGAPRFNFYSAMVGQSVYFETTVSLTNATFTQDLFSHSFGYNETGYVDFTHVMAVPEPSTGAMMLVGMFALGLARRRQLPAKTSELDKQRTH